MHLQRHEMEKGLRLRLSLSPRIRSEQQDRIVESAFALSRSLAEIYTQYSSRCYVEWNTLYGVTMHRLLRIVISI